MTRHGGVINVMESYTTVSRWIALHYVRLVCVV